MTDPRHDLYGELAHRRENVMGRDAKEKIPTYWSETLGKRVTVPEDAAKDQPDYMHTADEGGVAAVPSDEYPNAPTTGPMAMSPLTPEQLDQVLKHIAWLTNQYPPGHDDEPEEQPGKSGGALVIKGQGPQMKGPPAKNVGLGRAAKSITAAPGGRSELPAHISNSALTAAAVNPISGDDDPATTVMEPGRADPSPPHHTPMATDPPVSEPQRRAMFAAASGKSTLGIPKKVGEEFVGKVK